MLFIYFVEYINCTDVEEYKSHHRNVTSTFSQHTYITDRLHAMHNTTTLTPSFTSDVTFHQYWDLQKTVPFFLILVLYPLIHFKSPTFFTKFNAVGK